MSIIKTVFKNTFFLGLSNIFQRFFALLFILIVARYLGSFDFGLYSYSFAFCGLFIVLSDLGISTLSLRELSRVRDSKKEFISIFSSSLLIKIILSFVSFFLILIFSFIIHGFTEKFLLVFLVAISLILDNFSSFMRVVFNSFEKMEYEFIILFIQKILYLLVGFLVVIFSLNVFELIVGILFSSFFGFLLTIFFILKNNLLPFFSFSFTNSKKLFIMAIPFSFMTILYSFFANSDIVFIDYFRGSFEAGLYSASVRLIYSIGSIPVAVMGALFPLMSRVFDQKNIFELISIKSIKYLFLLAMPISVGIIMLSSRFISFFYSFKYISATPGLQVLAVTIIFSFLNVALIQAFSVSNLEKKALKFIAVSFGLNLVLNLIFIPNYGFVAGAATSVFSEALLFLLLFKSLLIKFTKFDFITIFVKPILATICMAFFIYFFSFLNLFILIFLSALIYFFSLFLLKTFSKEDYDLFFGFFK